MRCLLTSQKNCRGVEMWTRRGMLMECQGLLEHWRKSWLVPLCYITRWSYAYRMDFLWSSLYQTYVESICTSLPQRRFRHTFVGDHQGHTLPSLAAWRKFRYASGSPGSRMRHLALKWGLLIVKTNMLVLTDASTSENDDTLRLLDEMYSVVNCVV